MTTLQHSPAPWRVRPSEERAYCLFIEDADGCQVARLDASNEAWGGMDDDQFLQGDAALMSAAPKLLQAARCALADLEGFAVENDVDPDGDEPAALTIRELRAAIAQAEGGAQ